MQNMNMNEKTILVTGAAGFIGFYLSKRLIEQNPSITVVGFDSVNDYYDVSLKKERLHILEETSKKSDTGTFCFIHGNLADKKLIDSVFME